MTTENVDKHIVEVGKELIEYQNKVATTENIPVVELRRMLKVQSENMGVLQWLQEVKKSIIEQNEKKKKIISL
jgi:hypothetical protein